MSRKLSPSTVSAQVIRPSAVASRRLWRSARNLAFVSISLKLRARRLQPARDIPEDDDDLVEPRAELLIEYSRGLHPPDALDLLDRGPDRLDCCRCGRAFSLSEPGAVPDHG